MKFEIGNKIRIKRGYKDHERIGVDSTTFDEIALTCDTFGEIIDLDSCGCDYLIQVESDDYYGLLIAVDEDDMLSAD